MNVNMAYDILSNDLFDDDNGNPKARKNPRNNQRSKGNGRSISPILIHLLIIVVIILLISFLFLFFFSDGVRTSSKDDQITFIGKLKTYDERYEGDLNISSSKFTIHTQNGRFDDQAKTVKIKGFNGTIMQTNRSIRLTGTADIIEYGNNEILLFDSPFNMTSTEKTSIMLKFEYAQFNFSNGRIKINDDLNFEFTEATADLEDYAYTLTFDGTYSISGKSTNLTLIAPNEKISINYQNE